MIKHFAIFLLVFSSALSGAFAESESVDLLKSFYDREAGEINFAELKLRADQIVDPALDFGETLSQIDEMTARIRADLPDKASSREKVAVIRRHIYTAGDWNESRPFKYDLNDPLGKRIENKLLSTYFRTRLGNCVSMPILFFIQADRVGVDATISTAPSHFFVKYYDEDAGRYINLETTDGAHPARDEWIRQNIPMTDKAIEEGIYMRTLSRRDIIGVIGDTLMEHHWERGEYRELLELSELILREDGQNIAALIRYGSASGKLLEAFQSMHPDPSRLNAFQRMDYERLVTQNAGAFDAAHSLGWRPESSTSP